MSDEALKRSTVPIYAAFALIMLATILALYLQGRAWWCPAGDPMPWSWTVWSQHNSQHLIDPYSFTHMLHGILEFWIITLLFPKLPVQYRLLMALFVESSWEVIENTNYVINRYREATISLNYFGDSILNSIADVVFCGAGFGLGRWLKFWRSAAVFVITETVLLLWIHDSLLLNIVMLIYPIDGIREWQSGH